MLLGKAWAQHSPSLAAHMYVMWASSSADTALISASSALLPRPTAAASSWKFIDSSTSSRPKPPLPALTALPFRSYSRFSICTLNLASRVRTCRINRGTTNNGQKLCHTWLRTWASWNKKAMCEEAHIAAWGHAQIKRPRCLSHKLAHLNLRALAMQKGINASVSLHRRIIGEERRGGGGGKGDHI